MRKPAFTKGAGVCVSVRVCTSISAAQKWVRRLSSLNNPTGLCNLLFTCVGLIATGEKATGKKGIEVSQWPWWWWSVYKYDSKQGHFDLAAIHKGWPVNSWPFECDLWGKGLSAKRGQKEREKKRERGCAVSGPLWPAKNSGHSPARSHPSSGPL